MTHPDCSLPEIHGGSWHSLPLYRVENLIISWFGSIWTWIGVRQISSSWLSPCTMCGDSHLFIVWKLIVVVIRKCESLEECGNQSPELCWSRYFEQWTEINSCFHAQDKSFCRVNVFPMFRTEWRSIYSLRLYFWDILMIRPKTFKAVSNNILPDITCSSYSNPWKWLNQSKTCSIIFGSKWIKMMNTT
jgi:hypothetical protein